MSATKTDTVTLDRETFEKVMAQLGGLAGFAARVYPTEFAREKAREAGLLAS